MLKTCPYYNGMEENGTIADYSRSKLTKVPESILNRSADLEELYLDSNSIEVLPKGVFQLTKLRILSASDNHLCKLSSFTGNLVCLEKLDVSKNYIVTFPDTIVRCTQLAQLDASLNPIVKLSEGLVSLCSLTHLVLNETMLESLPENFGRLSSLKVLEIRHNQLQTLPKSMHNLKELERLDIGENKFINLPVAIGYLASLRELLADDNMIEEIPPVIGLLRNLAFLELSKNKLECLPPEIEALKSLTDMHLSVNELLELPESIGSLGCLQTLKLDENDLIFLPSSIGRLESLEELDITANNLEGLPSSIGLLQKLRVLTLDNNCIKSIPDELGNCSSLSLLSLHSNELIAVPETLGHLPSLQVINLSANMITSLPLSFLGLKRIRALWLSENQSKPVVPLQKKYNEKERKYVVSCHLLPQEWCEEDQVECEDEEDKSSDSPASEDKEIIDDSVESETFRTTGSISQSLVSGNNTNEAGEDETKPWYEQEFIESADDSDASPDPDEFQEKDSSVKESDNLSRANITSPESFLSQYSFKEEQPSSLNDSLNVIPSLNQASCVNDESLNLTSSGSTGTVEEDMHSILKGPSLSSSLLSPRLASSAAAFGTGAVGILRGLGNDSEKNLLAHAVADANNDSVYGNTSATSLASLLPPARNCSQNENSLTDHSVALSASDVDNMRLRFGNKRNRNGNPLSQYEAFKPTRFNLYQDYNDLTWSTLANDPLDASSPVIKKKSLTSKDNPLIGARLARDESPQGRVGQHTANQKYEEKIRALQQQRLKERSRRRNNSARVEYCGEQRDFTFSNVPVTTSTFYGKEQSDRSEATASPPHRPPPCYIISDEDDSVAIKLSGFALTSPRTRDKGAADTRRNNSSKIHETAVTATGRRQQTVSSPPVATNRFNGFAKQQRHTASRCSNNINHPLSPTDDGSILQATGLPNSVFDSRSNGRAVPSSKATGWREQNNYQPDNINITANVGQRRDVDQSNSYGYEKLRGDSATSFVAQRERIQKERGGNTGKYLTYSRSQVQELKNRGREYQARSEQGKVVAQQSDSPSDTSQGVHQRDTRKQLLSPANSVQHVTVKSTEIDRPVSPRLVMAGDERNSKQDVAFKEFSPDCTVEDVTSFLIRNIGGEVPMTTDQDCPNDFPANRPTIHEQVQVDCDVEEVTRNISKHLVGFSKVQIVKPEEDIGKQSETKVEVTDLDMPDAACPLSRNDKLVGNAKPERPKHFQVLSIPDGPKEEIQVRVYRSPELGFSIGGGTEPNSKGTEGIYVVAVKPDGPSSHLLKPGDRILEVNKLNLRNVSHDHAVLFLTHNQQLDLVIERII